MIASTLKPILLALALALVASPYAFAGKVASIAAVPVDNSKKNERDVQGGPLTPEDQSNTKADTELIAKIRQAVVNDSALSINAQNVKIISNNGMVTLRGPVENQEEKDSIAGKALQIAGAGKVVNQLEVITK